jgi:LysM repeat protein
MFTSEIRTVKSLGDQRDWQAIAGGESWKKLGRVLNFALRGSIAYGSRSFSQVTLGLGCRANAMELDYAFLMPLSGISFGSTVGTHKFSLSVRFGKAAPQPVSWEIEEEAPLVDVAAMAALRSELEDVRKRAEQTDELARQAQERIKALENARDLELELQKQKRAPDAQAVQPLEAEIRQLREELEKAKEESRKMEQKKAIIENKLERKEIIEKKPEKKEAQSRTAPEARDRPVSPKPVSGHTYVVQAGDTLRSIAGKAWGDVSRWIEIYRANEGHVQRGGDVEPGQIILIP